jgi:hypothetical protein
MTGHEDRISPAEASVYRCAPIADRPRAIDRYLDYFGGWSPHQIRIEWRAPRPR